MLDSLLSDRDMVWTTPGARGASPVADGPTMETLRRRLEGIGKSDGGSVAAALS